MKKVIKNLLLVIGLILLAGCSSYTVLNSKVYNNAVLTDYKTFSIAQPDQNNMPPNMSMRDFDALANAVKNQMLRRGYKESTNPDLMVYLGITIENKVQTKDAIPPATPYYFGGRGAWARSYYSDAQLITGIDKEGTLSVDIVDVKEQKVVYAGAVGSVMDGQQHIRDLKALDEAMDKLFKNFPVKPLY